MEPHVVLKLQAAYGEQASRILRNYEKKCKKKAKNTTQNYPLHAIRRENAYQERMSLRKYNRATHLARAFLKGTPYKTVEQSVRDNNQPDPVEVFDKLYMAGSDAGLGFVKEWLDG